MILQRLERNLLPLAVTATALALLGAGCAAGKDTTATPHGGAGGSIATGGSGGATSGGAGGAGGQAWPCGIDCSTIQTADCQQTVCNTDTASCNVIPRDDGTTCDDGEFCTVDDACAAGECIGGPANDCGMTPGECEEITCDEQAQSCASATLANGTNCTAADLCMVNATCTNGLCTGTPKDCFFAPVPDDCHVSQCNPQNGQCEPVPGNEGQICVDQNDLCTVGKTCANGVCVGGTPKDCSGLTQDCNLGVCDTVTGQCTTQALNNGDPCDDLDACTTGELCSNGSCTGGTAITSCVDNDQCCPQNCDATTDTDCILQVLLMGDDVSSQAEWDKYRTSLTAAGVTWTELDLNTQSFPDAPTLAQYNTVVWFDESTISQGNAEAQLVADWLALGQKNLFVTSVDFLWDFENGSPGQGEHNLYLLWGTTYLGDYAGTAILTLDGVANDPIGNDFVAPNGLQLVGASDSSGDYANEASGPAVHAALYGSGGSGSGHSGLSHYNAGNYKVVWLGINFHNGLTNPAQRAQLMTNIMNWFKN